jgi:hypothetical protein
LYGFLLARGAVRFPHSFSVALKLERGSLEHPFLLAAPSGQLELSANCLHRWVFSRKKQGDR